MKSAPNILHLGLDVHKETIAVAIASGDGSMRRYGQVPGHPRAVETLIKKLQKPGQELRFCEGGWKSPGDFDRACPAETQ